MEDSNAKFQGCIPLTASLYNALCDLISRSEGGPLTFWIDQICINQLDNTEKQHQVVLMKDIYQNASRVISYLGPVMPWDDAAFELLDYILDQYRDVDLSNVYKVRALRQLGEASNLSTSRFNRDVPAKISQAFWRIIYGPWTRRLWIVQEVCYEYY